MKQIEKILQAIELLTRERAPKGKSPGKEPTIPYGEVTKLLEKCRQIAREPHAESMQKGEVKPPETIARLTRIEEKIDRLSSKTAAIHTKTYAQIAQTATATPTAKKFQQAPSAPLKETPARSSEILLRIRDQKEIEELRALSSEALCDRIHRAVGGNRGEGVVAATQLQRGDIRIRTCDSRAKSMLTAGVEWVEKFSPSATLYRQTFKVVAHGLRVEDYPTANGKANAKRIEENNKRLHPELTVVGTAWLGRVEGTKEYASLMIETTNAKQANRLISLGMIDRYSIKKTELYDHACRITQCFQCMQYGHRATICSRQARCGYCGGKHQTRDCEQDKHAPCMQCPACEQGTHPAWSRDCPARKKELIRSKLAYNNKQTWYPEAATGPAEIQPVIFQTSRGTPTGTQDEQPWTPAKRRKIPGRPTGAPNYAKQFPQSQGPSISSLLSSQGSRPSPTPSPSTSQEISMHEACDMQAPSTATQC
jgi:hypothetical protein